METSLWIYIGIGLLTIVMFVIIAGILLYRWRGTSGFSTIGGTTQKTPELMFFYANWCPHCKTAKPEWMKTKEYLDDANINSHKVYCVEYDCTEKTSELENIMKEYKIEGFPTIKLQYDNTIYDFNDPPTKDNIISFLNKIMG